MNKYIYRKNNEILVSIYESGILKADERFIALGFEITNDIGCEIVFDAWHPSRRRGRGR